MRTRIAVGILLVLALLVVGAYAVASYVGYIGASWNHDPVTVYVQLDKGVDSSYKAEVQTALDDWSNRLKSKTGSSDFNFRVLDSPQSKRIPADIAIRLKKNTGAVLGSTSISASGENLAYTKITMATQNAMGKPLDPADFGNILRHELGHALGLGHANDDGSGEKDLMYPYYDFIEVGYDVYPSDLDLEALVYLYGSDGFKGDNLHPIPSTYS